MGLDMYLSAERSFYPEHHGQGKTYHRTDHPIAAAIRAIPGFNLPPKSGNLDSLEVKVEVMYWRKANAIHKWFVDEVQDGEDECRPHYVPIEKLFELRSLCKEVMDKSELEPAPIVNGKQLTEDGWKPIIEDGRRIVDPIPASEILPTQGGFFFGGTQYDEHYFADIKQTYEGLTKLLEWHETTKNEQGYSDWSFEYRSSW